MPIDPFWGQTIGAFDDRFTMRTIKVVSDGALGSRGAALIEPYSDGRYFRLSDGEGSGAAAMLERALRLGFQVETHAIGDRANQWYSMLMSEHLRRCRQLKESTRTALALEHAQILARIDIARFAKARRDRINAAIACDWRSVLAPSRLGMKRLAGAYDGKPAEAGRR